MVTGRRYLTFSLRALFALLTVLSVWLGIVVNSVREQRAAVKAIEALGGEVRYDWEEDPFGPEDQTPCRPAWLPRLIGFDFFREVEEATFLTEFDLQQSLPHLKRLRNLRLLYIPDEVSEEIRSTLKAAFPACELVVFTSYAG